MHITASPTVAQFRWANVGHNRVVHSPACSCVCYIIIMEALLRQRIQQPSAERPDTMKATLRGAPLEHNRVHSGGRTSSSTR